MKIYLLYVVFISLALKYIATDSEAEECMSVGFQCDGYKDCPNGEDEENCSEENPSTYWFFFLGVIPVVIGIACCVVCCSSGESRRHNDRPLRASFLSVGYSGWFPELTFSYIQVTRHPTRDDVDRINTYARFDDRHINVEQDGREQQVTASGKRTDVESQTSNKSHSQSQSQSQSQITERGSGSGRQENVEDETGNQGCEWRPDV